MKKIILCLWLCLLSIISLSADSSSGCSEERMAMLRVVMNKKYILTFVSHPRASQYFLEEKQRLINYTKVMESEIECLRKQFPRDPVIRDVAEEFSNVKNILNFPLPYSNIILPFLTWGACDTSGIKDAKILKNLQNLQIKLFKNWLAREGIGYGDNLVDEIEKFSNHSSLPIFSQVIKPFLSILKKTNTDLDDILSIYSGSDDLEELSSKQRLELEAIYNPPAYPNWYSDISTSIDFNLPDFSFEEDDLEEPSEGEVALQCLIEQWDSQCFYRRDSLFKLFFEIMMECYPDDREFFSEIWTNQA